MQSIHIEEALIGQGGFYPTWIHFVKIPFLANSPDPPLHLVLRGLNESM